MYTRAMVPIKYIRLVIAQEKQAEFAERIGVSQATISRWESGETSPSIEECARIRAAYPAVTAEHFFTHP